MSSDNAGTGTLNIIAYFFDGMGIKLLSSITVTKKDIKVCAVSGGIVQEKTDDQQSSSER